MVRDEDGVVAEAIGASGRMPDPARHAALAGDRLAAGHDEDGRADEGGRAVLVGHSLGWDVVRAFALRRPERVAALVNVDGAYCRVPRTSEERVVLEKLFARFSAPFADTNPESVDKARASFIDTLFAPETPEPMRNWIRSRMSATPPHVARSAMLEFLRLERWTDTRPVKVPTLAVYAEYTARQELPGHRDYLRALNPSLEYEEWPGSGHFVMTEDADRLNRRLLAFLESVR